MTAGPEPSRVDLSSSLGPWEIKRDSWRYPELEESASMIATYDLDTRILGGKDERVDDGRGMKFVS